MPLLPRAVFLAASALALATHFAQAANEIPPTAANIPYGDHPDQVLDVYVPPQGDGPFPVLIWYGGLWKPAKNVPDPKRFLSQQIAEVAVQVRVMDEGIRIKADPPVSVVLLDARRAVQFVRLNAKKWNLDPNRIVLGGGSQGALPALFVGCTGERADAQSADPVERVSSKVLGVAAYRSQPTIDPRRMQEWVPGVQWGAPAFGMPFPESLKKRDELQGAIDKWSPDALVNKESAPMYFENEWGMTRPEEITEANYNVHSPAWGAGFQKIALERGATCCHKYPGHPTEGFVDIWDFIAKTLKGAPVAK